MTGRIRGKLHRSPRKHRTILGVVLWTLLISLLMPGIALDTRATRAQDGEEAEQPPALECGEGTIPDDTGTDCVPDPNLAPPPLECGEATIPNDEGTDCVPDPDLQPPPLECPEGEVPDETGSGCIPDPNLQPPPLDCDEGTIPNDDGTACVSDPNARSELECDEGMVPDETESECVLDGPTETPVEDAGDDANALYFSTYLCPAGTPHEADKEHYEQNCQPASGWEFELQHPAGSSRETSGPDGRTTWSGVPVGDWTATETLPEGYGDPIVYCRYTEWPEEADEMGDWPRSEAVGGSYSDAFAYEGMHRECDWYNFSDAGSEEGTYDLAFTTFVCPPGIPTDQNRIYYEDQSCLPAEGWAYQVQHGGPGGTSQIVTNASGAATERGIPAGSSWGAVENLKEGFGEPRVWCRVAEWTDGAEPDSWAEYRHGQFSSVPQTATRVECHWYNFAGTDGTYIDFGKYTCPSVAPLEVSDESRWYADNCQPFEGWEFEVQWSSGEAIESTDASGHATWPGLPIGVWRGSEVVPEGWGTPYFWCDSTWGSHIWTLYTGWTFIWRADSPSLCC